LTYDIIPFDTFINKQLISLKIGDKYISMANQIHEVLTIQGDIIMAFLIDWSGKKVIYKTTRKEFLKHKNKI